MADFALAMMALFLVLWIVNNSNEQERAAISGYFQDPLAWTEGQKVPSASAIDLGGSPSVANNIASSDSLDPDEWQRHSEVEARSSSPLRQRMPDLVHQMQQQIHSSPRLKPFRNQLLLNLVSEGVQLQIVEQTGRPMFESGNSRLTYYAEDILWELAPMLASTGLSLSVIGHTDSQPTGEDDARDGNWLLSASRADAAREALMEAGVGKSQIAQVIGKGDTVLLKPEEPGAAANRRIELILLNESAARPSSKLHQQTQQSTRGDSDQSLESLIRDRERLDNSYDNPPNRLE